MFLQWKTNQNFPEHPKNEISTQFMLPGRCWSGKRNIVHHLVGTLFVREHNGILFSSVVGVLQHPPEHNIQHQTRSSWCGVFFFVSSRGVGKFPSGLPLATPQNLQPPWTRGKLCLLCRTSSASRVGFNFEFRVQGQIKRRLIQYQQEGEENRNFGGFVMRVWKFPPPPLRKTLIAP